MIEHIHPDGEPTPTVRDLYERRDGSAEAIDWNKDGVPTKFRLTDRGYATISVVMRRNAAASLARGTENEEAIARLKRAASEKGKSNGRKSAWTPA